MSFCLNTLLMTYEDRYQLHLAAGENGAANSVTWVYLAEDIENIPLLQDSELIITTGLFTRSGTTLMEFLSAIIAQNQAGIILNIGKYLQECDITPEIRALCLTHQFPLYTMPWEVHLTDVMQSLCTELLKSSQKHHVISTAFRNLLLLPEVREYDCSVLTQNGFREQAVYTLILVSGVFPHAKIHRLFHAKCLNAHVFQHENDTLVILMDASQDILSFVTKALCQEKGMEHSSIGVSAQMTGIGKIRRLYRQAWDAQRAAKIWKEQVAFYDDIGVLALVFSIDDRTLLSHIADKKLHVLDNYDQKHNAHLVDTLFYYLKTGGSLAATAELLYTHRNTIGYRMNQIRELCETSFESSEERYDYLTAIYIRKALLSE